MRNLCQESSAFSAFPAFFVCKHWAPSCKWWRLVSDRLQPCTEAILHYTEYWFSSFCALLLPWLGPVLNHGGVAHGLGMDFSRVKVLFEHCSSRQNIFGSFWCFWQSRLWPCVQHFGEGSNIEFQGLVTCTMDKNIIPVHFSSKKASAFQHFVVLYMHWSPSCKCDDVWFQIISSLVSILYHMEIWITVTLTGWAHQSITAGRSQQGSKRVHLGNEPLSMDLTPNAMAIWSKDWRMHPWQVKTNGQRMPPKCTTTFPGGKGVTSEEQDLVTMKELHSELMARPPRQVDPNLVAHNVGIVPKVSPTQNAPTLMPKSFWLATMLLQIEPSWSMHSKPY